LHAAAGASCATLSSAGQSATRNAGQWLSAEQNWEKQKTSPVISLGQAGQFDDMHIFAPCVGKENGRWYLWYPGSRGEVADRIFRLGLATSDDGVHYKKNARGAVFEFADGRRSILTPTVLRDAEGSLIRENGKLRLWFSGVDLRKGGHALYEVTGTAPDEWGQVSEPLLRSCYAPSVLKEDDGYRMWFTDVSVPHWLIRHAWSKDGREWNVEKTPSVIVDQGWEERLVIYPAVVKVNGVYLMWYSSYYWWNAEDGWRKTAIGFAVSKDGVTWEKKPNNPVLRPDTSLPWESYYNSSQCIVRLPDGRWRMWYGGRKEPPWVNKYFSICSATWNGPA
jgi:predicted GH43/DUF377 family glycosyl hydrolase